MLILLLAIGLRLEGLTFDSLWLDESYQTMVDAYGQALPDFTQAPTKAYKFEFAPPSSVNDVLKQFRKVDMLCPPLHAVLLNRWMKVFGETDAAIRSLSVLSSVLAVAVLYWVVFVLFGRRTAFFSGMIHALSPFDIYYAQEARMYSLLVLGACVSFGSLLLAARHVELQLRKSPRFKLDAVLAIYLAAHALGAWTLINAHYTGLFVFLAEILFGLWCAFALRHFAFLGACIGSWFAVALLWLPWLPLFFEASKLRKASFYVTRDPAKWWWPFIAMVKIVANWIAFLAGKKLAWYAFPAYGTSALLVLAAVIASIRLRRPRLGPALSLTGVWMWLLVPPMVLLALDIIECHRVVEIPRYVMATSPAIYVLAGIGMTGFAGALPNAARYFFLGHCIFALLSSLSIHLDYQREPWRNLAAKVDEIVGPNDLVLVAQHYDLVCLNRYLTKPLLQVGISPAMGQPHLLEVIAGRKKFFLITAQEGEAIAPMVPTNFAQTQRFDWPHGLHLRQFQAK